LASRCKDLCLGKRLQQIRQQQQQQQLMTQQQQRWHHLPPQQQEQQRQRRAAPLQLDLLLQLLLMAVQGGRLSSARCMPTMRPHLPMAAAGYALTQAQAQQRSSSTSLVAGVLLQQLLVARHQLLQAHTVAGPTAGGQAACEPSHHLLQKTQQQTVMVLFNALVLG
jgi:hypothetical protein